MSAHPRSIAMAIAVLLHLAMLALLIASGSIRALPRLLPVPPVILTLSQARSTPDPTPAMGRIKIIRDAPRPSPAHPAARSLVSEVPLPNQSRQFEPIDFGELAPQFDTEPDPALTGDVASAAAGNAIESNTGQDCALVATVRDALEQNVEARTALARIPSPSRSVANAVMLWDGEWIAPENVGGPAALEALKEAITGAINSASAECRSRTEMGPVFLIVHGAPETIVLALGSGAWRWSDLLPDATLKTTQMITGER